MRNKNLTVITIQAYRNIVHEQLDKYIQGRVPKEQDKSIIEMLTPERLFEIIQYFTLYDNNVKKVARYQQFFGIQKAIERITLNDDKGTRNGVIWHTQGSGKSLTMVMLVKKIIAISQEKNSGIKNPRFVLVNDRINLDKQLRDNFSNTQMSPARAKTGKGLIDLLKDTPVAFLKKMLLEYGDSKLKNLLAVII